MADRKPIGLDGGRLATVDPAADRLVVGALYRDVGSMSFEDDDVGPVTLAALARYIFPRKNVPVIGTIDGVNAVFTLPFSDKGLVESPGVTIETMYNGQNLLDGVGNDVTLSESGGGGTGFDTITFLHFAPRIGDNIQVSYFKAV
jgi:hypothetical protein